MAGPYNLDTGDPTDTSIGSAFPTNERAFRTVLMAYLGAAVDATTGMPFLPITTVNPPIAGTFPNAPKGALVFASSGTPHLFINTGTPAAPVWLQV